MSSTDFAYPKLHNALWPGVVGKGGKDAEPCIDFNTMLDLTAKARANGARFDGVDLFLFAPHVSIDATHDELKVLADRISFHNLVIGDVVAPVWPPTGGGPALGTPLERYRFLRQVEKGCRIAKRLRELQVRPYGVVRIDSASSPAAWEADRFLGTRTIVETFQTACDIAADYGERLAAEGEICWGGMQGWMLMVDLLEKVGRKDRLGFQADMAHTLLYTLGYNAPEANRILASDADLSDPDKVDEGLRTITAALRPWTISFHVAQNDGTVKGAGAHDKTGRHCLPNDPNGKLDIPRHAGFWLRDERGNLTKSCRHVCWDGCMFPNATLENPATWDMILATMVAVRNAHGWNDTTS